MARFATSPMRGGRAYGASVHVSGLPATWLQQPMRQIIWQKYVKQFGYRQPGVPSPPYLRRCRFNLHARVTDNLEKVCRA